MAENTENFNRKLNFEDTKYVNIKFVNLNKSVDVVTTQIETEDIQRNDIIYSMEEEKPKPKYNEKEIIDLGEEKSVPSNWKTISETTKFDVNNDGTPQAKIMSPPLPPQNPGPCCMNDNYEHFMKPQWNRPYVWNAVAGGVSPLIPAVVPQSMPYYGNYNQTDYNIIPASGDEFVYGVWNWNLESGALIGPNTYQAPGGIIIPWGQVSSNFGGTSNPGNDTSVYFYGGGGAISWSSQYVNNLPGGGPATGGIKWSTEQWSFPSGIFGILSHNFQSGAMQTQIDWSNSLTAYANSGGTNQWENYYNFEYAFPADDFYADGNYNQVPQYVVSPALPIPFSNPFCQGRALINPGQPYYPNPWPDRSFTNFPNGQPVQGGGKLDKPRRMGWEGWILRPHNVKWNWGNRGAYEDILHYTVGPSEQGVVGTSFTNQWNALISKGNVLDGKTCSDGYCDYPQPSPIYDQSTNQYITAPRKNFYGGPDIGWSQLEHQRDCCSNSQWFQNARVLRNYSEEVWNLIGSPFNGGNRYLTINEDTPQQYDVDLSFMGVDDGYGNPTPGLVGTNGNGPPIGSTDAHQAKFSCTTFYTLNRILQYISSPSDFEEIYAQDFGNNMSGPINGTSIGRMWFPVQAGYYDANALSYEDEPYENMYRFSDVGRFYVMINLCGQVANESIRLGELGNLGNPPIAQIDTTTGGPDSKLNPGIFPWGHCITYACGNPEYSPNYDSATTANGGYQINYNKLGERGCEAQTPWAQLPLNHYYNNVTFAGIKVWFFDESTGDMTSKMFRKWSFSNSNEWDGQVPSTYEEASESAIGFMMWLGHNSWDYTITNPSAFPNSTQAGLYGSSVGRPAGRSGGTGVEYWEPVNADGFGNPIETGHFVYSLSNQTVMASRNGYYKGIRPNYSYLDVATHLLKMEEEWPIKRKNVFHDYDNRPTGEPEYIAGVPVPGTYKTNNPQTGIAFDWWDQGAGGNIEPNGYPYFYQNPFTQGNNDCCSMFPGEGNCNPWSNYQSPHQNAGNPGTQNLPPPTDPSWNGLKDGPGNPGGGNYCTQEYMLDLTQEVTSYGNCQNWSSIMPYYRNFYIDNCFKAGQVGQNYVHMPTPPGAYTCFNSGDVRGVFQDRTIGCVCFPWYSQAPIKDYLPQLLTGPHCEGCNVGCCTNEFNSVNKCEYVYPQGLFKSKRDCASAYANEPVEIPVPFQITPDTDGTIIPIPPDNTAHFQQLAETPEGRRKTYTSPLGDTTFCKLKPEGIPGCLNPNAINYSPAHTLDCSGSEAWTYRNNFTVSAGLNIDVDYGCCVFTVPGWACDENVDNDNDGMGDCLQTCSYGNIPITLSIPFGGNVTVYVPSFESNNCYSAKTDCEQAGCAYNPTSIPGYSCDYPNSNSGCVQNTLFSLVNPPTQAQLQTGGPYSSLTQCEQYNGGPGAPFCNPQAGYYCAGNGYLQPGLSILPFDPQEKVDGTDSNNSANFFRDGCVYTTNYYGPPQGGTTTWSSPDGDISSGTYTIPAGKLYPTREECVADCYPCVDTDGVFPNQGVMTNVYGTNIIGSGSRAQDWCNAIKDELQNQFGNFWTEADLNSAQFADPNPTNPPSNYSPNYDSSWYSKYKNCCMGRISAAWKYNSIEENALKQGVVGSNGSMYNSHGQQCCSGWQPPNLGFGYPLWGDQIRWDFVGAHWTCNFNASSQDLTGNYAGSFGTSSQSFEFVPGKGYQPKRTWPLGAGNDGPDGACEGEPGKVVGTNNWNDWGSGVGYKT